MCNRRSFVQSHPLATFFGLTFLFSKVTWPILGDQNPTGPLLAALIVVPIIGGWAGLRARDLIRQTCATLEVEIIQGHVAVDHVHLLVSVRPNVSLSQLMQRIKGRSSRRMLDEFDDTGRTRQLECAILGPGDHNRGR